eukprot:153132-Hanusia_phi.AAC.1
MAGEEKAPAAPLESFYEKTIFLNRRRRQYKIRWEERGSKISRIEGDWDLVREEKRRVDIALRKEL